MEQGFVLDENPIHPRESTADHIHESGKLT